MPTKLDQDQVSGLSEDLGSLSTADSSLDTKISVEDSINDSVDQSLDSRISKEDSINDSVDVSLASSISGKQNTLVSGTNIKTINGSSILGSGNISISGVANPITIASINGSGVSGLTNAISASILIPAGTITTNKTIYIKAFIDRTVASGAGNTVFRFYMNTSNVLAGATLLGSAASMASTVRFQRFERNIFFDGTNLNLFNTAGSSSNDYSAAAISLIGFNPSVNNYLIFSVQHSSSTTDVAAWKRVITQAYD